MRSIILIHVVLWGYFALSGMLGTFSYFREVKRSCSKSSMSKGRKFLKIVLSVALYVFVVFGSTYCFYIVTNKYISDPIISNPKEVIAGGKRQIQYQDTTHFCDGDDESTCFMSLIPVDGKTSKNDVCIICGMSFLHHDTHKEHSYFKWMRLFNDTDYYSESRYNLSRPYFWKESGCISLCSIFQKEKRNRHLCAICLKPFLEQDTHRERDYHESMTRVNDPNI